MSDSLIELFTVQQLAEFLHKKTSTIYSDLTRRPESLPPVFRAPGSSKPLFVNPKQWVADLMADKAENQPPAYVALLQKQPQPQPKKKRGRPTNQEKNARAAAEQGGV
jgi:hypothetical protein